MFDAIATVLAWFYGLVHNYALAIALLTLVVMILLTPLTLKGTRSMIQMQRLAPELKKIQQEYKHDRQAQQEAVMKFYQENKLNPVGGCLPLLLQAPVFIVLFRVLDGLTKTCSEVGLRGCTTVGNFAPKYIDQSTELWKDLAASKRMGSFGLDLSESASQAISRGVVHGLPYLLLVLVVAGTSYIQQWQISVRNKGSSPIPPQQQLLLKVMPVFFAVFSLAFASGLVIYFLVSNLYRIAQNAYITKRLYSGEAAAAALSAAAAGGDKPRSEKPDDDDGSGNGAAKPKPKPTPRPGATAKKPPAAARGRAPSRSGANSGGSASSPPSGTPGAPAPTRRTTPPRRTPPPPPSRKKK